MLSNYRTLARFYTQEKKGAKDKRDDRMFLPLTMVLSLL